MIISFLTLFFGLIAGPYSVELAVSRPVAAVEVTVDGRASARIPGPPYKARIDFGRSLLPHRIVARALDADGQELARTEEWANLPHSLAKVEIVTEPGPAGTPRAAKVVWTDLAGGKPSSMKLTLDGVPVALDADGRGVLAPHDLTSLHVLTAEVKFPDLRSARRDLAYGGEYGSEVSTELTAVPLRSRTPLPPAGKLAGWLAEGGRPLPVVAVEEGPAQVFVVRVASPAEVNFRLADTGLKAAFDRFKLPLAKEDRVRFVQPQPKRVEGSGEVSDLFGVSPEYTAADGGFPYLLRCCGRLRDASGLAPGPPRIADAVAVAGQQAMAENRRRAVVLLLSGTESADASGFDAATVRRFLEAIRVPLHVWTLSPPAPGSVAAAWGGATGVWQRGFLTDAVNALKEDLGSQHVVMVDGRHLPQSIALGPAARGVELVAGGSRPEGAKP